ncbi:GspE/PulE family protein [Methylotenera sp.]|uniref:GspE/PulE family protein n=1 Tax=Methylotenera sp. TaxID=2051956 RepID=UPI002ED8665F
MENNVVAMPANTKPSLSPIPPKFNEHMVFDYENHTVYIDQRFCGDTIFLTWIERNRREGISLSVKPATPDELAKLRASVRVVADIDTDLKTRQEALGIILTGAQYGASDIHITLKGDHSEVQFETRNGLVSYKNFTQSEGDKFIRSIYQGIAKLRDNSFKDLEYQSAQVAGEDLPPKSGLTSVRIMRGPCYPQDKSCHFMTLRLQYADSAIQVDNRLPPLKAPESPAGTFRLANMGYSPRQIEKISKVMDAPDGVIIYTGPTGSGKTTSLNEVLTQMARLKPHRRLVTAEDPVEYPMPWAVQLPITGAKGDKEIGAKYAEYVRTMLRMAPKTILLGELRGPEVAIAAIEASITGHQVLTTIHTTDPFLVVDRLEIMDPVRLNRKIFCDPKIIRAVVGQRLIAQLCPHCSIPIANTNNANMLDQRIRKSLSSWGDIGKVRIKGKGCDRCGHSGSVRRLAIPEIILTNTQLMNDYIEYGSAIARRNYRRTEYADPSMIETAIRYVLAGYIDPVAVEGSVDLIELKGAA